MKDVFWESSSSDEPERRKKVREIVDSMDDDQVKKFVAAQSLGVPDSDPGF